MKKLLTFIKNVAEDFELDRDYAYIEGSVSYILCILRQLFIVTFSSIIILSVIGLVSNKAITTYHYVAQEYDNYKNNRITDGNGNVRTTLSNGKTVNVSLKDGKLNVTLNGKKLETRNAPIYSVAIVKDDILNLTWFSGTNEVYDLTTCTLKVID